MNTECKRCGADIEYKYRPPLWCKDCRPIVHKENRKKNFEDYLKRSAEAVKPKDATIKPWMLVRGLKQI